MTNAPIVARRPSGRDARRAERAGPLPDHLRPVKPGMTSGRYRPLSDSDVQQIHHTALRLLSEVGLADATPSGIEVMTRAGATSSRFTKPRCVCWPKSGWVMPPTAASRS